VFQNQDLGHSDLGRKIAMPFPQAVWNGAHEAGHLPPGINVASHAPDHTSIGLGWRYLLIRKCRTVEDAVAAMAEEGFD